MTSIQTLEFGQLTPNKGIRSKDERVPSAPVSVNYADFTAYKLFKPKI